LSHFKRFSLLFECFSAPVLCRVRRSINASRQRCWWCLRCLRGPPSPWNGLPADVVTLPPFSVVKQPLKTSLFIEEEEQEKEEDFAQTTRPTAWKLCGDLNQRCLSQLSDSKRQTCMAGYHSIDCSVYIELYALFRLIFMAALCNRGPLYFCPVVSIFYLLSFFFFLA